MMRWAAFLFVGVVVASPSIAAETSLVRPNTDSPNTKVGHDDLQQTYDAMWQDYKSAVTRVSDTVETFVDEQVKPAAESGNLELSLFWDNLKAQYLGKGKLSWDEKAEKKNWRKKFPKTPFPDNIQDFINTQASALRVLGARNLRLATGDSP